MIKSRICETGLHFLLTLYFRLSQSKRTGYIANHTNKQKCFLKSCDERLDAGSKPCITEVAVQISLYLKTTAFYESQNVVLEAAGCTPLP